MRTFKHTTLAALAASLGLAGSAMAQTAEVIHWWTSGGESAAVRTPSESNNLKRLAFSPELPPSPTSR